MSSGGISSSVPTQGGSSGAQVWSDPNTGHPVSKGLSTSPPPMNNQQQEEVNWSSYSSHTKTEFYEKLI
ncbi:hypothetical protein GUJ93_ZPchr0008g12103 [Zizania palustris]|uniref:Uncharacterized protein n=1 Tax=Zizania palustris TaxID=103762 RepID=A0A8J5R693_ZIZPA|nr:hypothetical protein GUJ93_ZPchr0008g12103 [Zizania palustris]